MRDPAFPHFAYFETTSTGKIQAGDKIALSDGTVIAIVDKIQIENHNADSDIYTYGLSLCTHDANLSAEGSLFAVRKNSPSESLVI